MRRGCAGALPIVRRPLPMMLATALALALSAPMVQSASSEPPEAPDTSSIYGLGGAYASPYVPPMAATAVGGRLLDITLNLPGHTYQERFVIGIPQQMQTPAPVLTLFHGYGEDPVQVVQRTDLVSLALARGWVVYIPLGAHHFHYGIDYAQENIEDTFAFIASRLPLDLDRVYGVGFSMGGGAAASFAARHLDPNGVRFAALVNHTGTTSLRATYHTSNDTLLFRSPLMFGGSPAEEPFGYLRSSTIDFDVFTGQLDPKNEMARNLARIPTQHWYATFDVNQSIVDQTVALDNRLDALGAPTEQVAVPSAAHSWSTLDARAVLDWLEPQRFTAPAPGEITHTLADRSGRWYDLDITQRRSGGFTPVLWSGQPGPNALYLVGMENAEEIRTDLARVGLDTGRTIHVIAQVVDGEAPSIVLEGFSAPPFSVQLTGSGAQTWSFDAATGSLTLEEIGQAGWSQWSIVP